MGPPTTGTETTSSAFEIVDPHSTAKLGARRSKNSVRPSGDAANAAVPGRAGESRAIVRWEPVTRSTTSSRPSPVQIATRRGAPPIPSDAALRTRETTAATTATVSTMTRPTAATAPMTPIRCREVRPSRRSERPGRRGDRCGGKSSTSNVSKSPSRTDTRATLGRAAPRSGFLGVLLECLGVRLQLLRLALLRLLHRRFDLGAHVRHRDDDETGITGVELLAEVLQVFAAH